MDRLILEFQGASTGPLLPGLAAVVSLLLLAWGIRQVGNPRRRGLGSLAVAAAFGPPIAAAALWVNVILRMRRNALAASSLLVALATTGLTALAGLLAWGVKGGFWPALLGAHLAVALGVLYAAAFTALGARRLSVLLGLRLGAALALLAILLKPVLLAMPSAEREKPMLAIALDASGSMATQDQSDLPARYAQAVQMLRAQQARIEQHFTPRWIYFAAQPQAASSLERLADIAPDGPATDLATALQAARDPAASPDEQAGIVLLSDGIDNTGMDVRAQVEQIGVGVCAIGVGSGRTQAAGRPNLRLESVRAPLEAVINNVTQITARVRMTQLPSTGGEIRLYEGDRPTPVATEKLWSTSPDETVTATLRYTPQGDPGEAGSLRRLRVEVDRHPREVTSVDNDTELHVLLTNPRLKVLYVNGSPRPEYKFLRRALATDPNIQLVGLVRVRGNTFVSQGSLDGEAMTALPDTAEAFGRFDVVILGSLDRSFWSDESMGALREFVNDGGGLVMLGGAASFGPGGYAGTAVERMLPVEVGGREVRQVGEAFLPELTAAGEAHPIFEGITGYFPGPGGRTPAADLAQLQPLEGCVEVLGVKPAASLLAVNPDATNARGPLVVLATQRYGAGRTAAFTADTTWLWYMPLRAMGARSPYHRFWGQLVRWLAHAQTQTRQAGALAMLRLERTHARLGEPIDIRAYVQDTEGQGARDARVAVTLGQTDAPEQRLVLEPADEPGHYAATWTPQQAGAVELSLSARSARDEALGKDLLPVVVEAASKEMEQLARNDALLRDLAVVTGGRYADLTALPDVIDDLIDRQRRLAGPPPRPDIHRLYHFPVLFIAFVVLLTAEWLLRRRWQLQ